ncbi:hypothetical protein F2Q69_00057645 [Brassica cretica]|uniref:Methyltransferase domain-containing protein n=1 Tax=Brassica cretica TaxID=69181 RepID=A0A8S9MZK0_BRACR|nr:hypothetical protein F2Q69_00057645 [Brassica cretica]
MTKKNNNNEEEEEFVSFGHNLNTKIRFEDADEDEAAQGSAEAATAQDESMCDAADGTTETTDDTTSADYYFDSYSHFGKMNPCALWLPTCVLNVDSDSNRLYLLQEMLKDVVRTKTYQNVIYQNKFLIKDKVVLDVGAGTGILSLFCAKAGAKQVYAVECSQMADMAKEIVKANGFSDVITVLKGKIEEIELPTPKVDVIISEWMGYFLLFENMLDSVLYARNKWLVDGGIVLPDKASLFLTAIEDSEYKEDKIEFWNSVYGFDMSCIKKKAMMEPLVDTVDQKQIVTDSRLLKTMDISKMSSGDASFTAPFKIVAQRNDYIHALVAYFDVSFTMCHKLLGPKSRATHWKQTVMYLEDVLTICEGETITGSMSVSYNKKNPRDVDIKLSYSLDGQHSKVSRTQHYKMR